MVYDNKIYLISIILSYSLKIILKKVSLFNRLEESPIYLQSFRHSNSASFPGGIWESSENNSYEIISS